ncbi:MAG TPA: hypothetical protein VIJ86_00905 [Acidimicrobiales bacterium]
MLINQIGVEDEPVVYLDSRRDVDTPNPKSRVSTTTLLQVALNPVPRSPMEETPSVSLPVTTLPNLTVTTDPAKESSHSDVA